MTSSAGPYTVRTIDPAEHAKFVAGRDSASFLQTPGWGRVKSEWGRESIGWYDGRGELVGVGLVLYRQIPRVRRYLAYLPEGPVIDWASEDLAGWLTPMADHLAGRGAFGIRMGPPVVSRTWSAETLKKAIADGTRRRLDDVPPDHRHETGLRVQETLRHSGWRPQAPEEGFGLGQPQYVFQLPLANRSEDDLLKGMNQLWRRNIKKADKLGVEVHQGTAEDLPEFHRIYRETAERDGFRPRPLAYFQTMFDALLAEDSDRIRLYLAHHEGALVAATTWVRVGTHAWYSYGASTTEKREVRGSNAVQWRMIRDARAAGAAVYDLRGITNTLDESDPHRGLLQFKVGTGGEAVEYFGEWDLPISRLLYSAFDLYMRRR
ncbi:MAG: peptidoglycan bridge formation glycyltransferase FemA/FemB family protein [Propionibacteriales bacterium]|nr:peptidoglycan bridge formation glycyltransferase FemA/FemB family protein [Propionibacteriales bacterium]